MILDSLVQQLKQRLDFEKRASVCLWFDEKGEFTALIPALAAHLAEGSAAPFRLLAYDAARYRGQIWIRRQIQLAVDEALDDKTRKKLRFVVYLPLPEEMVSSPAPRGPSLDLLTEMLYAGIVWRIGGKRPTLFSFLRSAGIPLPDDPSEQRRLYEGGASSLLAKYAVRFVDRPPAFWMTPLTADVARERLVDVDQTILDLAVDPDTTMSQIIGRGTAAELQSLIAERYGFDKPLKPPREWLESFVALVALTEAHAGYGESHDFPFLQRLPPAQVWPNHQRLLQRWLRDAEARPVWDRLIGDVEKSVDLSNWASGRRGVSFAFPHLVRLRWQAIESEFESASEKATSIRQFFISHRALISKEAEYAKAAAVPAREWNLLASLDDFLKAVEHGLQSVNKASEPATLVQVYVANARQIDGQHLRIRLEADEVHLPTAIRVADRFYSEYVNALNGKFFELWTAEGGAAIPTAPDVTSALAGSFWNLKTRRALIIIDALRYDCALAILDALEGHSVVVSPMLAKLPTITPVGMTALMPLSGATIALETKANSVRPIVNGRDMSARQNRLAFLSELGADCRDIGSVEAASKSPPDLGDLLVVFGHDDVDHIGHGDAQSLVRHLRIEIDRVARLIRKLHRWGYPEVHVVTDHGFIAMDEEKLPPEVKCAKEWCLVRKERFAIVAASADVPLATFGMEWDSSVRIAVPPGAAFFQAEQSFSHGGATLQELVIPHLVSKVQPKQAKLQVEIIPASMKLSRPIAKVTVRPKQLTLFGATGRMLSVDVVRMSGKSVVAGGGKTVSIAPNAAEETVTLFFGTSEQFSRGEVLDLRVRDVDTEEQIPPGGIKLIVDFDS